MTQAPAPALTGVLHLLTAGMGVQVLYNLCEWPTRPGARLAVVGIANTLDLPERLLPRIASRLGGRRVVFQPYKRDQLKRIVDERLRGAGVCHVFQENAIKYAAGKVRCSIKAGAGHDPEEAVTKW